MIFTASVVMPRRPLGAARGWQIPSALVSVEPHDELLRSPGRMFATQLDEPLANCRGDGAAVALGTARAVLQPRWPGGLELVQPLVPGLRRDAERCAEAP